MKIIIDRVIREGPTWDRIIRDVAGTDIERRDKALACLRFLSDSFPGNKQADAVICHHSTYKAIVDCLCNLLPEARTAERTSAFRTQPERNAVYVLRHILDLDIPKALEAGVISKWLVQYPFDDSGTSRYGNKKTIMEIIDNPSYYEDIDFGRTMRGMLFTMSRTPSLRKEMVAYSLLDAPKGNDITDDWDMLETPPRTYPQISRTRSSIPVGTSNRRREESFEEQALRRRRREAMVLGEAGRPIERADIIERDSAALDGFRPQVMASLDDELEGESEQPVAAVTDEDVEEELELLMEEIIQAESVKDQGWWAWLKRLRPDGLAPEPT